MDRALFDSGHKRLPEPPDNSTNCILYLPFIISATEGIEPPYYNLRVRGTEITPTKELQTNNAYKIMSKVDSTQHPLFEMPESMSIRNIELLVCIVGYSFYNVIRILISLSIFKLYT